MCKLTSKLRLWFLRSNKFDNKIKCAEELIGKNSVTPWIKDKIIISPERIFALPSNKNLYIVLKENKDYDDFIGKLAKVKGVSEVTAIAAKNDVDY